MKKNKGRNYLRGKRFEKECFEILCKLFDKVTWKSKEVWNSKFDFICEKNGRTFNVDAKLHKHGMYSKKDADYIITKKDNEIILIEMLPIRKSIKKKQKDFYPPTKKLLAENPKGLTIQEIADILGAQRSTIAVVLAELKGEDKIFIREIGQAKLNIWNIPNAKKDN